MPSNPPRLVVGPAPCALLAALFATMVVPGCEHAVPSEPAKPIAAPAESAPTVETIQAALHDWPTTVRVQGSLQPDEQVVVGAKVPGRVAQVRVDLGAAVRQGDVLAILDSAEFELRARQAEAQLAEACAALGMAVDDSEEELDRLNAPPVALERALLDEANALVERARRMIQQRVATLQELEQQEAQQRVAAARYASALNGVDQKIALVRIRRAELALARQQQADATIVAPFDGIVQERYVAPGGYLSVGQPVVMLVRTDPLRFRAAVPERVATHVRLGQAVEIRIEGQPEPRTSSISRVSPGLDLSSRSLLIEADLPNPGLPLRGGLFAEADIILDPKARTLAIPAGALFDFAGVQKVWLIRDGQAQEHPIRSGRRNGRLIEILDGLGPGDQILADAKSGRSGPVRIDQPLAATDRQPAGSGESE